MVKGNIAKIYEFVHELRSLKDTERYSNNPFVKKRDVVASHSWRAETFPILLHKQFLEEGIDPLRVLELLNIHDWVEIECKEVEALGFRNREEKAKKEKEVEGKLLARFSGAEGKRMRDLISEFMEQKTLESRIAKALENLESNMHVIEEVTPILDPEHRVRTIDYIARRKGISRTIDNLVGLQLAEIEKVVKRHLK